MHSKSCSTPLRETFCSSIIPLETSRGRWYCVAVKWQSPHVYRSGIPAQCTGGTRLVHSLPPINSSVEGHLPVCHHTRSNLKAPRCSMSNIPLTGSKEHCFQPRRQSPCAREGDVGREEIQERVGPAVGEEEGKTTMGRRESEGSRLGREQDSLILQWETCAVDAGYARSLSR